MKISHRYRSVNTVIRKEETTLSSRCRDESAYVGGEDCEYDRAGARAGAYCFFIDGYGYGYGFKLGLHRSPTSLPLVFIDEIDSTYS